MAQSKLQICWDQRFNIAGALLAAITAITAPMEGGDSWPIAMLCIAFFIIGNLDRFENFKAGPGGIEATLKKELQKTNDRIDELKELAVLFGDTTIANIAMMGRWDGFSDEQEEKMISDIVDYYDKLGIPEDQKQKSLALRYLTLEHDYRILCTGGHKVPGDLPDGAKDGWDVIREGGLVEIAKPDEIEKYFKDAGILTAQRKELIADYRHYLEHRKHRRPEIWAQRQDLWGR